jgi:hypothetical protein
MIPLAGPLDAENLDNRCSAGLDGFDRGLNLPLRGEDVLLFLYQTSEGTGTKKSGVFPSEHVAQGGA